MIQKTRWALGAGWYFRYLISNYYYFELESLKGMNLVGWGMLHIILICTIHSTIEQKSIY